MKVEVTHHAVERFRERIRPGVSDELAVAEIERALAFAGKLRSRTPSGDEKWKSDLPAMVVVVKRASRDADVVVVTVLGPGDSPDDFPELAPPAEPGEERQAEPEVEATVTLRVRFRHLRGDRQAAAREAARRVANAAARAAGSVTGLAQILGVEYQAP